MEELLTGRIMPQASRSSVVSPDRFPPSTSAWWTHLRRDSGPMPSCWATLVTTPNRSRRSLAVSRTMRTARSRSSGGYRRWNGLLLCSAMTPCSSKRWRVSIEVRTVQAVEVVRLAADHNAMIGLQVMTIVLPRANPPSWRYDSASVTPTTFAPAMLNLSPTGSVMVDNLQVTSGGPASGPKIPRNAPCWCGSGRKYKRCHGAVPGPGGRARGTLRIGLDPGVRHLRAGSRQPSEGRLDAAAGPNDPD
jgi:hypothetical protein